VVSAYAVYGDAASSSRRRPASATRTVASFEQSLRIFVEHGVQTGARGARPHGALDVAY
jgi:hypothetical protein